MADLKSGLSGALRNLLPSAGRHEIVGLSIEGNDLRLICVAENTIVRFISRPLDPDLIAGGVVTQPAVFGAAVKEILTDYELRPATVIAGFPDVDALSKVIELPKERGPRLDEVVQREARREFLMDSSDYRLYYQVVAQNSVQMTVFLLAVRRAPLADFMEGLKAAGIVPAMVDLRPLAMIRAVNQPQTIIAHVERTGLDLVVVRNNLPLLIRSVPVTGIDEIVDEIGHNIDAYNSDRAGRPLDALLPVALSGEMSAMPDLRQAIQDKLGRPIAAIPCPLAAPPGFDVANFIVNIGLVLKVH